MSHFRREFEIVIDPNLTPAILSANLLAAKPEERNTVEETKVPKKPALKHHSFWPKRKPHITRLT